MKVTTAGRSRTGDGSAAGRGNLPIRLPRDASIVAIHISLYQTDGGGGNRTRVRGRTGQSVYKRSPRFEFDRRPEADTLPAA